MADLIDRGDFRQAFECVFRGKLDGMSAQDVTRRTRKLLKELPGVDAVSVVHAHWIDGEGNHVGWDEMNPDCPKSSAYCSVCGDWLTASDEYPARGKYCPNCGAKMDLEV